MFRRPILLAIGVGALGLVAISAVALLTRPEPSAKSPDPDPASIPPAEAPGLTTALALPPPPPAPPPGPPPISASFRAPDPAVPQAPRPAAAPARRPGVTVSRITEIARPKLAPCFDPDAQARYGRQGFTAVGKPGRGQAVLTLQLEAGSGGRARVVDAPVLVRGDAEDGLLACAQQALRGIELPAAGVQPGARLEVRYPLQPVSGAGQVTRRASRVRMRPR
jgi:hypothetical protein